MATNGDIIIGPPYTPRFPDESKQVKVRDMEDEEILRIAINLRGDKALRFNQFRKRLSEHLGFNISTSETIMWTIKHSENRIDE